MSKAITDKTEDRTPQGWGPGTEIAPSLVLEDEPKTARTIGLLGASFVIFGSVALFINAVRQDARVGIGWASVCLALGVVGLLAHAAFDRDLQVRRLYWGAGLGLLVLGGVLCLLPAFTSRPFYFGLGYPGLVVALLFLLAALRHETDRRLHDLTLRVIGAAGLTMAVTAFLFGNNFWGEFLIPYGLLLALVGLAYLTAFASGIGSSTDLGYRVSLALGALGALVFVVGLLRSGLPPLLHTLGWVGGRPSSFLAPWGLLLMGLGLLYLVISVGLWSDNRLVVLTRRELAAYFYSPLAYIALFGMTMVAWILFLRFVDRVAFPDPREGIILEPIIARFLLDWPPVICLIFIVPVLTMRLLSEEKRSGTLEVLLTVPVSESTVVLSKFLACLVLFLLMWLPWGLFLVGLRIIGGVPYDYQPILSFFIALACTGAGFVAMGLFFSSLTRNQVASAVLAFAGMLGLTMIFFVHGSLEKNSAWGAVITHVSYIDLWITALQGYLVPKYLLFHLSAAVFWLFLTTKVLEARRWS